MLTGEKSTEMKKYKNGISWHESYEYAKEKGGRLPTLCEVRSIIAQKAHVSFYSTEIFFEEPLRSFTINNGFQDLHQVVAVGTEEIMDFVSIGKSFLYVGGFNLFPGASLNSDMKFPFPPEWDDHENSKEVWGDDQYWHKSVLWVENKEPENCNEAYFGDMTQPVIGKVNK